jgi:hypothetical protein
MRNPIVGFVALVALAVGLTGLAQPAPAQTPRSDDPPAPNALPRQAVVELFTSQGCSSCPAADALLHRLADRDDIIALSFPVDYWDYLGWRDTLASPKFSERQRAYARSRGDGAIYTPQVVVNGLAHVNGSDEGQIGRAIETTAKTVAYVPIRLSEDKDKLIIEAAAAAPGAPPKDATLWLAVIATSIEVPIARGENQGKTVTYYNVVRELMPIGMWSGKTLTVQLERSSFMRPGTERCAVLLQQGHAGPIIGAALMKHF